MHLTKGFILRLHAFYFTQSLNRKLFITSHLVSISISDIYARAGLTLVNATNVFICEPLLNAGLELQAISRVHRIGQTKPTTVWLYVVSGTVEQSVLNLATTRRLALAGVTAPNESESNSLLAITETKLDEANSVDLQRNYGMLVDRVPGGGEVVGDMDLLECLVGSAKDRLVEKRKGEEVRRHVMAEAAEKRIEKGKEAAVGGAGPSGCPR